MTRVDRPAARPRSPVAELGLQQAPRRCRRGRSARRGHGLLERLAAMDFAAITRPRRDAGARDRRAPGTFVAEGNGRWRNGNAVPARVQGFLVAGARVDLHGMSAERTIAVALHDVEPATFERCALIRDWLADHGVDRVTLLVVPAPDLHPFFQRRPDLAAWLLDCRDRGDTVAQHGFQRERGAARRSSPACDAEETRASLEAGPQAARARRCRPARLRRAGLRLHAGAAARAGRRLRLVGDAAAARRPRARRAGARALAAPLARSACAPAPSPPAACCGSTCTRRTSTARAACSRSSPSCAARSGRRAVTYDDLAPPPFAAAGTGVAHAA